MSESSSFTCFSYRALLIKDCRCHPSTNDVFLSPGSSSPVHRHDSSARLRDIHLGAFLFILPWSSTRQRQHPSSSSRSLIHTSSHSRLHEVRLPPSFNERRDTSSGSHDLPAKGVDEEMAGDENMFCQLWTKRHVSFGVRQLARHALPHARPPTTWISARCFTDQSAWKTRTPVPYRASSIRGERVSERR